MSKKTIGWILVIIGLFMLFKMVRVSHFGFYCIAGFNTSAIILILLIISAIAVVANTNKITIGCLIGSIVLLVLSLLLGLQFYFAYSSLVDVLLVLIPVIVGTGLIIKSAFHKRKALY